LSFSSFPEQVKELLCLFDQDGGVEGPGKVLRVMDTQELNFPCWFWLINVYLLLILAKLHMPTTMVPFRGNSHCIVENNTLGTLP